MKNVIALVVLGLMLSGCVSQNAASDMINNTPGAVPETHAPVNLSFSRNASDVMTNTIRFPDVPQYDFTNTTTLDGRLIVHYFYSSHCGACTALRPEIEKLKTEYGTVEWLEYDLGDSGGNAAYLAFAARYNLSAQQRFVPQVLVNGTIITDRFNINDSLESTILNFTYAGGQ